MRERDREGERERGSKAESLNVMKAAGLESTPTPLLAAKGKQRSTAGNPMMYPPCCAFLPSFFTVLRNSDYFPG